MAEKYYAVYNGREGTQIYLTWEETKVKVNRMPGVKYKKFRSLDQAQAWLQGIADAITGDLPPPYPPQHPGDAHQAAHVQPAPGATNVNGAGPSGAHVHAGQQQAGAQDARMSIDYDSDIEILDGPPPPRPSNSRASTRARSHRPAALPPARAPSYNVESDSDIEILEGPPPTWNEPGLRASRTPNRARPYPAPQHRAGEGQQQQQQQREQSQDWLPQQHAPPPPPPPVAAASAPAPARGPPPPLGHGEGWDDNGDEEAMAMNAIADANEPPPPTAPAGMFASLPGPIRAPEIQLSEDQLYVLAKVKQGESVFFTGSAGTGKSVLLREIIKYCGGKPSMRLGVTASTGIASVNIGGCTLHSWAGIGLGKEDKDGLVGKILGMSARAYKEDVRKRKELWKKKAAGGQLTGEELAFLNTDPSDTVKNRSLDRWRQVKTLIIDEISMIDGKLFDKLEYVARKLRKNELAFGGIQLVLSGDFCQLPPVPDKSPTGGQIPACFAFDAESWPRCVGKPIVLNKVFRQKDQKFVDMLNAMRFGLMDEEATRDFLALSRSIHYEDGIEPTELYPTRNEVESANSTRLARLPGNPRMYRAKDAPGRDENGREYPKDRVERGLKDVIAPKDLPLKIGAQVMLIKNIIQGVLVNGSVGKVVGFYKPREAVAMGAQIAIPDNREQGGIRQASAAAGPGGGSKVKQERTAGADGKANGSGNANGGVEMKDVHEQQREQKLKAILALNSVWPAVQFQSGPLMLCVPLTFEVINADANIEAVREQVPLILAWALSIHKSQGQTLQRVRVDLQRIFEKGQAYVALSRATRMETLQVLNFDAAKVRAHPRVLEWMAEHMDKVVDPPYIQDDMDDVEFWDDLA